MSWVLYAALRSIGTPKPQPRIKAFSRGGHAGVYTPTTARGWKEIVMLEAASLAGQQIEGPIALGISFVLPRPKAHKKETFVTTKPTNPRKPCRERSLRYTGSLRMDDGPKATKR